METDNKLRPLYLLKLLYTHTDEDHPLSTGEIVQLMEEQYGVKTQRTRIPQDIELLERFGYEIGHYKGQSNSYYLDHRLFELPELKLLIDAVESSSFITEKKSVELVEKLTSSMDTTIFSPISRSITCCLNDLFCITLFVTTAKVQYFYENCNTFAIKI